MQKAKVNYPHGMNGIVLIKIPSLLLDASFVIISCQEINLNLS
jgi:hypothetical protein